MRYKIHFLIVYCARVDEHFVDVSCYVALCVEMWVLHQGQRPKIDACSLVIVLEEESGVLPIDGLMVFWGAFEGPQAIIFSFTDNDDIVYDKHWWLKGPMLLLFYDHPAKDVIMLTEWLTLFLDLEAPIQNHKTMMGVLPLLKPQKVERGCGAWNWKYLPRI